VDLQVRHLVAQVVPVAVARLLVVAPLGFKKSHVIKRALLQSTNVRAQVGGTFAKNHISIQNIKAKGHY
jgi:hypothetical protein